MGNQKVLITVVFPEWEQLGNKYPQFAVKYLVTINSDDHEQIESEFKEKYEMKIGKKFDGTILFIEDGSSICIL